MLHKDLKKFQKFYQIVYFLLLLQRKWTIYRNIHLGIGQVGRVEYFWDDPMTPIYGMFSKSLDTKVVVELVASGVDKAAKIVPSRPRGNYAFMYDLSYLENWKDVLSDDFGVWCPNGTKTMWYKSEVENTLEWV